MHAIAAPSAPQQPESRTIRFLSELGRGMGPWLMLVAPDPSLPVRLARERTDAHRRHG